MTRFVIALCLGMVAVDAWAITISGRVRERGTKAPLKEVNVFILPHKLKATTDLQGQFSIGEVPPGEAQIVINATGYLRFERAMVVGDVDLTVGNLAVERVSYNAFETTILDQAVKRDDTTRTMRREQFLTMPGSNGDPVKAVQNLPGVARSPGVSARVVIQGSAPEDTSYVMDHHKVPLVFHFGGLTSVITPEAVEQVDYLSAGYGVEYGRAMGGLIGLRTRDPATDRMKGFASIDTAMVGGLIETPIDDKSALLVTGRYSYIGEVIKAAMKDNDDLDLTVAPTFADLTGIYTRKVSEKDTFRLLATSSRDELKFLFKNPVNEDPKLRGTFSNETKFFRLIPQWTHNHSAHTTSRWSLGVGKDWINAQLGEYYFDLEQLAITQRAELERRHSPQWTSILGMDNELSFGKVRLRLPQGGEDGGVSRPAGSRAIGDQNVSTTNYWLAPYWRNTIKPQASKWTYTPALRLDHFSKTEETLPSPRGAVRYDISDTMFWRAAGGLYYQPPQPEETDEVFGNPDVKAPHSWHLTTGIEKDFRDPTGRGFVVSPGVFYRLYDDLVVPSTALVERQGELTPERYSNSGSGHAYGLELQWRFEFAPWSGFLSYTWSRSVRSRPGQGEYLFEYDQTHNVNVVGQLDLPRNWKLSARVRYVTGNPMTPVESAAFDADNDVYVPKSGPFYSERMDPFFQTDFRIDKKFIGTVDLWWLYLDIQNITNSKNVEGVRYSYDYSEKRKITGLPIFPTLGLRGEF